MDNQQERPIASPDFLAGLIVGEGSYGLNIVRPKKHRWEIKPCFSLRMNDVETIDLMQRSFAHHGLALYRSPGVYARCHSVRVDGLLRMRTHLDFFLPLLSGTKLRAAQVVSEYTDRRLSLPPKTKLDDTDVDYVERMREINGPSARRVPIGILRDYTREPDKRGWNLNGGQDIVRPAWRHAEDGRNDRPRLATAGE